MSFVVALFHKQHHIKTILVCKIIVKKDFIFASSNEAHQMALFPCSLSLSSQLLLFDALAKLDCTLNTRIAHSYTTSSACARSKRVKYFNLHRMPIKPWKLKPDEQKHKGQIVKSNYRHHKSQYCGIYTIKEIRNKKQEPQYFY